MFDRVAYFHCASQRTAGRSAGRAARSPQVCLNLSFAARHRAARRCAAASARVAGTLTVRNAATARVDTRARTSEGRRVEPRTASALPHESISIRHDAIQRTHRAHPGQSGTPPSGTPNPCTCGVPPTACGLPAIRGAIRTPARGTAAWRRPDSSCVGRHGRVARQRRLFRSGVRCARARRLGLERRRRLQPGRVRQGSAPRRRRAWRASPRC